MAAATGAARHYGMDWLRIGAFGLLILYHVGMVFVVWDYHIKAPDPVRWLSGPMLAVSPWRLMLLFVVSGYASRTLLARSAGPGGFARLRSTRLLVPLAFGVAVIVPPQSWVELVTKYGYDGAYLPFWARDFFSFRVVGTVALPGWNHLWFVAYLWVYTLLLALAAAVAPRWPWQRWFDAATGTAGGLGVLLIPIGWLVAVHGWWFVMVGESHALLDDWVAHATYFPAFLFGVALAGAPAAMAAIGRWRHAALALAVMGYAAILWVESSWSGHVPAPRWVYPPYGAARALQQWGAIVALIALAERHWNHDAPGRATLTEAVFPAYLVHQTIIVVAMFWLLRTDVDAGTQAAILVAATALGCWLFYAVGRRLGPLRPLIGLRAR